MGAAGFNSGDEVISTARNYIAPRRLRTGFALTDSAARASRAATAEKEKKKSSE
jgi:hypothetical protein